VKGVSVATASLTQAVPGYRHLARVVGVPGQEERVEPVHLQGDRVHDGLAVRGAVVEQHVQQGLVGEVSQAPGAGQCDLLDSPGGTDVFSFNYSYISFKCN